MLKCAECECNPLICEDSTSITCNNCTKDICCCIVIHKKKKKNKNEKPKLVKFFSSIKSLYAAALGIEILCIAAAEIGENSSFALFGYGTITGIALGYVLGYTLSTFTTFATILGRYNYGYSSEICSCCSVLEQDQSKGFVANLLVTFKNFTSGIKKMPQLYKQPNIKNILKTSLVILVTAESACILTAETVDLFLYRHSMILSIPLALLAGAFTVVAPEAYRKTAKSGEREEKMQANDSSSTSNTSFTGLRKNQRFE
jgi:hypothetical protein